MIKNAEVYITGGSGQLGKVLRKYLFQKGINTKVLSRKIINLYENEEHINFCLGDKIDINNLRYKSFDSINTLGFINNFEFYEACKKCHFL